MVEEAKPKSKIMEFFSNPVVGVTGTIASIVGVTLAIIFFVSGREHRELCFYANPARAVIFKAGQASRLSLTLDGEVVGRDVSAVQVAFWNEGKKSIKREHVLRPLVIKTSKESPILEATIRKESRDVIGTKLDLSKKDFGEIKVDWNILEQVDGAVIQLVYFGDTEVPITASSIIEGQGEISVFDEKTVDYVFLIPPIFFALIFILMIIDFLKLKKLELVYPFHKFLLLLMLLLGIVVTILSLPRIFKVTGPPFGF